MISKDYFSRGVTLVFFSLFQIVFSNIVYLCLHVSNSGSFPKPLTASEEHEYLQKFKEGDMEARAKLIEHNLRLVAHIIKKYYSATKDQDDLISIGTIGLIKAVSSFNGDKGTRLATYAARCIENAIITVRKYQSCSGVKTVVSRTQAAISAMM